MDKLPASSPQNSSHPHPRSQAKHRYLWRAVAQQQSLTLIRMRMPTMNLYRNQLIGSVGAAVVRISRAKTDLITTPTGVPVAQQRKMDTLHLICPILSSRRSECSLPPTTIETSQGKECHGCAHTARQLDRVWVVVILGCSRAQISFGLFQDWEMRRPASSRSWLTFDLFPDFSNLCLGYSYLQSTKINNLRKSGQSHPFTPSQSHSTPFSPLCLPALHYPSLTPLNLSFENELH